MMFLRGKYHRFRHIKHVQPILLFIFIHTFNLCHCVCIYFLNAISTSVVFVNQSALIRVAR